MKLKAYLFEILLLLFSVAIPFALDMNLAVYGMLATFLLFLALRRTYYGLFLVAFGFIAITCVLFLPQIIWFGHPPATMIGAFFETDFRESKEFMQSLPLYAYGVSVLTLLFSLYILYLGKKKRYVRSRRHWLITGAMALVGIGLTVYRPLKKIEEIGSFSWQTSRTAPIAFYASIYNNIEHYQQLRRELNEQLQGEPTWQIESSAPAYCNYVLVIGESVCRDYMSVYGFPIENSPFLKQVKGTILDGYTAAAPNTTTALLCMFLQRKGEEEFVYENNLISLAKGAGFETYWLSNQGSVGTWDTPISKIASLSDHRTFTKMGEYDSMNIYDTALLPVLKRYLQQKSHKPRLLVVHIMGSHLYFPERLESPIHYDYYNRNFSAYLQTIEQTDSLLSAIYAALQAQQEPFSLLYFADHGLMTKDRGSYFATLTHGDTHPNKACYRVPFALISSDDTEHKQVKVNKSAFNFLSGYAHWLGIRERSLDSHYDFLSPTPDSLQVFDQYKNVPFADLAEDEVIK